MEGDPVMTKHNGLNHVLLVATLMSSTIGLTSTVGVLGAFGVTPDEMQAPRAILTDSSSREQDDPLQAPRAERGPDAAAQSQAA
jgi:hypothetical protein